MSTPYLILTDALGITYNFPISFFITDDGATMRTAIKDMMYAHGGKQTADGFVASRKISIEGELFADTKADFETAYRLLMQATLKGGYLSVSDDSTRNIYVESPVFDSSWEYYPRYKKINIVFDAKFPFWQDATETIDTHIVAGDATFTTDLSGSDHIVLPIFEFDSDQGVDVPDIQLTNLTDSGMLLHYVNSNFLAGNVLVIDCQQGQIILNNVDALSFLVSGAFLRLMPTGNAFVYNGAACTIKVRYRNIYL